MSMAIKYSMMKQAKKMATGGSMPCSAHGAMGCEMCHGGSAKMAEGGETGVHMPLTEFPGDRGHSRMGESNYLAKVTKGNKYEDEDYNESAKDDAYGKLAELRQLSKKDRRNFADGGYAHKQSEDTLTDEEKRSGYETQDDNYPPYVGQKYADGGKVEYDGDEDEDMVGRIMSNRYPKDAFEDEEESSGYQSMPDDDEKSDARATTEDDRDLNQHGKDEEGAEGTEDDNESEPDRMVGHSVENQDDTEDMVGRIIKQRMKGYSEGGRVANDTPPVADFEDNQFDDLVKRDDLHEHYTGANSGDEIGNSNLEELMHDIVARVMASRAKKDRNPVPA